MLELPEAIVISEQLNRTVKGKRIKESVAAVSPHKFAWYFGDPAEYGALLRGRMLESAYAYGGRIEIEAEGAILHFGDGAILRYYEAGEKLPVKHQLLVIFDDSSALVGTVAMYGGLWAFPAGSMDDDFYYKAAREAVPPLSDRFDYGYFLTLFNEKSLKMSAKAFLATEQRIPGLGNGVLQDILFNARLNPKTKLETLSDEDKDRLFDCVKQTIRNMTEKGGRDTEKNIFGNTGGYTTILSKKTLQDPCPVCGGTIIRKAYLGGNVYYCPVCQPV